MNSTFTIFLIACLFICLYYFLFNTPSCAKTITINNLKVNKIIDGDTIWVKDSYNNSFKIRLLNINTPELNTSPPEPYAIEAKRHLQYLLNKQIVYIKYESSNKRDKYNRLLAHVFRKKDNLWINNKLVELGIAYVYVINNNSLYLTSLLKTENNAIMKKLNIWSHKKFIPINPENAINFLKEYKIIIGKIHKVIATRNNYWLIFTNNNNYSLVKKNCIHKIVTTNVVNKLHLPQKTPLVIKIKRTLLSQQNYLEQYIGKMVKVRGYIEQLNSDLVPFINLKNINNIEIFRIN